MNRHPLDAEVITRRLLDLMRVPPQAEGPSMEHVSPIQICAVVKSTVDGFDATLRLAVPDPGVPHTDVHIGSDYPTHSDAIVAVITFAAQRLRPHTLAGTTSATPPPQ